jgi:hypothetical protein
MLDCVKFDVAFVHFLEGGVELLHNELLLRFGVVEMYPGQFGVGVQHLFVVVD